ncbi:hypothetical protein PO909_013473 [Leuciscus waleckii]
MDSKVIRESSSPYASPIVLVQKKTGELRMCVDYRQLNAKTRKDAYPLPRIEESLDALSGAQWFSTLDLASGYNQVAVAESDKPKTAFCTPFGLFEFERMPFGLCNAPGTFQRLMERIFGDQSFHSVLLYLDDVIIFSSSVVQHLQRLEMVLSRLQQKGLKAKLSKCHFFRREVQYLGHRVSKEGVATDPEKISAVSNWRRPCDVTEVRSFLGFCSYYRRFVKGFAQLAAPLHQLVADVIKAAKMSRTRPAAVLPSMWTERCERSFTELKRMFTSAPILAFTDFTKPFVLEIDASHQGLGAVLSQEKDGKLRPVSYASRSLRGSERNMENYSSMKLEFLALKWAVSEKFREYLLGSKCAVYTDNNPLSHFQTLKLGATEQRWVAQLAAFDFTVHYRPGKNNANADSLSRQYNTQAETTVLETDQLRVESYQQPIPDRIEESMSHQIGVLLSRSNTDLATLQEADPVLKDFLSLWRQGRSPSKEQRAKLTKDVQHLLRQWDRILEKDGVLYRKTTAPHGEPYTQLLLPQCLHQELLRGLHDQHGHQGVRRTTDLVRQRCYWPGMGEEIEKYCQNCQRCVLSKAVQPRVKTYQGVLLASQPLEVLAIDFTLLESATDGRENVLVMRDVFSKKEKGVAKYISQLVWAYNTSTHRSTGHSPYSLMFGVTPQLPVDFLLGATDTDETSSWDEWVLQHQERLQVTRELARKNMEEAADYRQRSHNQQVCDTGFTEGQLVYLKDHRCQGRRKIQDVWSPVLYKVVRAPTDPGGPYTVTLVDGTGNVRRVHITEIKASQLETIPSVAKVPQPCTKSTCPESNLTCRDEDVLTWVEEVRPIPTAVVTTDLPPTAPNEVSETPVGEDEGCDEGDDDEMGNSQLQGRSPGLRRTRRATAGKNQNPHNLPRSAVSSANVGMLNQLKHANSWD